MSIYKYIAAIGIVVASLYVRVYRRLAAEVALMKSLNGSFTIISGTSCSRVVLEYAISRLGSVGVSNFAFCVTTKQSSAEEIRPAVARAIGEYMDSHVTNVVVGNFRIRLVGARAISGWNDIVGLSQIRLRVGGEYVYPYELMRSSIPVENVLIDMPTGAIRKALSMTNGPLWMELFSSRG